MDQFSQFTPNTAYFLVSTMNYNVECYWTIAKDDWKNPQWRAIFNEDSYDYLEYYSICDDLHWDDIKSMHFIYAFSDPNQLKSWLSAASKITDDLGYSLISDNIKKAYTAFTLGAEDMVSSPTEGQSTFISKSE